MTAVKRRRKPVSAPIVEGQTSPQTNTIPPEMPNSPVPRPPKFDLEPQDFFNYWASIPEDVRMANIVVYAYRVLPILDVLQPKTAAEIEEIRRKHKAMPQTNIGKLVDPIDPKRWVLYCVETWGAGDYHFKLNNVDPAVNRTICMTNTRGEQKEFRDWDNYPPVVNLAEVVLTEDKNKAYIRWAHLKGIRFPGEPGIEDQPQQEKEEEMATIQSVEKLTDAVIRMSERPPQQQQELRQDPNAVANLRGAELVADAGRIAIQTMADTMKQAQDASAKAQDPNVYFQNITAAAKMMMPPPAPPPASSGPGFMEAFALFKQLSDSQATQSTAMFTAIQQQNTLMMQQLNSRLEATEKALSDERARAVNGGTLPGAIGGSKGPVDDLLKLLEGAVKFKDRLEGFAGASSAPAGPVWLEPALEIGGKVIDAAQNMMHNYAIAKAGQGTPLPPPTVNGDGSPTAEIQQSEEDQNVLMMKQYAKQIKDPLCQALRSNMSGSRFAGDFLVRAGEMPYQFLVGQGEAGLFAILQSDSGTWGEIIKFGAPRVQQFITEFLDAQAAVNEAAMIRAGNQNRPTVQQPPPAGRPSKPPATITVDATPVAESQVVNGQAPAGRKVLGKDGQPLQTAPPTA